MDRPQLAEFLRTRRAALHPEDVGLAAGSRRRTAGLRREEVAQLAGMSTDYLSRLEQSRGPQPSEQMLGALARALHLGLPERDHLFRLAGHTPPDRISTHHVSPGVLRILDRLQSDTPAMVVSEIGEALVQTPLAKALLGNLTGLRGLARSTVYRWYTDPGSRDVYVRDDHEVHGRAFTAELRAAASRLGSGSQAAAIVDALIRESAEFRERWAEHEVADHHPQHKRFQHPEVGVLELDCQNLVDPDTRQRLLVFTALPRSDDAEKLALLSVIGSQSMHSAVG